MFPTLQDFVAYFFHINIPLPIQTFGFFVALSFALSYQVFKSEFKRKEQQGLIHPFIEKEYVGFPPSVLEVTINTAAGFVLGFKVIGILLNYRLFAANPVGYIFSLNGSLIAGLIMAAIFAGWIYTDRKRKELPQPIVIDKKAHPYQLVTYLVFMLGFWGFIGARLFDVIEHFNSVFYQPAMLFSRSGLTFYGGLVFGALAFFYICTRRGMKLVHLLDIGSPGMMLAYAIGRIGCELSGDGDWGIPNRHVKPAWLNWLPDWAWVFKFPHNVVDVGIPIYNCVGAHCTELPVGVYPTSLYEAVVCLLLFAFLWAIRRHLKTAGLMFAIYFILNGMERILIEKIRVTDVHRFLGLYFTQAQFVGLLLILGGMSQLIYIIIKKYKPRHSYVQR